jgi:hypothetical protein
MTSSLLGTICFGLVPRNEFASMVLTYERTVICFYSSLVPQERCATGASSARTPHRRHESSMCRYHPRRGRGFEPPFAEHPCGAATPVLHHTQYGASVPLTRVSGGKALAFPILIFSSCLRASRPRCLGVVVKSFPLPIIHRPSRGLFVPPSTASTIAQHPVGTRVVDASLLLSPT